MKKRELITTQEQISAYSWKTTYDIFIMTTEFLEKYIEVAGYYPDWENRKQIHNNRVQRKDKSLEEAEKSFSTMLFLFYSNLVDRPSSIREKVKEEYYQWVNATGINVNNCPPRLKHVLIGINEVLEGKGEKILEDVKNAKRDYEVGSSEYGKALNEVFADVQNPLDDEEETKKSLEGKSWKEVEVGGRFGSGDNEQNKETFQKIKNSVSASSHQSGFHFFPQKEQQVSTNQGKLLTNKVKQNLNEWNIKEVIVFKGYHGGMGEVKELALVHQGANLRSYNWQGNLEIDPRMIYFKKDHQAEEWNQIERLKGWIASIDSYQSTNLQHRTNSEIIQDIRQNPQNWRLDEIITQYNSQGGAERKEMALIHSSAQIGFDGAVMGDNQPVYLAQRFDQSEIAQINQALNISQQSAQVQQQPYKWSWQ